MTRGANLVLASGVVAGTWTRKGATLTVTWLGGAEQPDRGLFEEEADRLATILGTGLELDFKPG